MLSRRYFRRNIHQWREVRPARLKHPTRRRGGHEPGTAARRLAGNNPPCRHAIEQRGSDIDPWRYCRSAPGGVMNAPANIDSATLRSIELEQEILGAVLVTNSALEIIE